MKGRKIGFKEIGGGVEEISSTLFIDSDEACIKSDFSIFHPLVSLTVDLVCYEEVT